jgi:hypothetical protein
MNTNLTLWNSKTLNYWEKLCIQLFSQPCQFILEQTIHEQGIIFRGSNGQRLHRHTKKSLPFHSEH